MKEMILHLPDKTYERLVTQAAAAHISPEQWVLDHLSAEPSSSETIDESHALLTAAMDALGFQRLTPGKAKRLSTLLERHKTRSLSDDETGELQILMTEAEGLELESLQRLAAVLQR